MVVWKNETLDEEKIKSDVKKHIKTLTIQKKYKDILATLIFALAR